jgi:hypothetical protein
MRFLIIAFLLLTALPCLGLDAKDPSGQVWTVGERRWTEREERQFGVWVDANLKEDFFIRYKIPVDCADVPYAVRWIYSRIAHLPAAATTKDGHLIGQWSTRWRHLPTHPAWDKDARFRAALLYILSETTTRTLPLDTYPVRIDPESVTPGTVFFVTESHSGVVGHVILDGSSAHPVQTWEATIPSKPQKMSQRNFLSPRPESTSSSGLVKFRWPVSRDGKWTYLPAQRHPFYSEEQYSSNFYEGYADYVDAVAKRIDPVQYDPAEKVEKLIDTITQFLQDRAPIVLDGFKRCHKGGCPEGSTPWELYSTPGRDGMITLLMDHLHHLIESNPLDRAALTRRMESVIIHASKETSVTFNHLYQNYLWLSPHPEDSVEARWGLRKCELIARQMQSARSSLLFIEKNYRKRDPRYADFSSRQQQDILRRLTEEWDRSQCKTVAAPVSTKQKAQIR